MACLEHEALRLLEAIELALLPLEGGAGGHEIRDRLGGRVRRLLDLADESLPDERLTDAERANLEQGIAAIEQELAAAHPWYADELRRSHERAARGGKIGQRWIGEKRLLRDLGKFFGGSGRRKAEG